MHPASPAKLSAGTKLVLGIGSADDDMAAALRITPQYVIRRIDGVKPLIGPFPQQTWSFRATARGAVSVGGDGLSSEELPFELRPSAPRKHLAIGEALAAAVALAIAVAEAADSYLWIAIGSALGGLARHWCNTLATEHGADCAGSLTSMR
jgi:hypothetical protein